MKTEYKTPAMRLRDIDFARNFLASGKGENTNPWDMDWNYDSDN